MRGDISSELTIKELKVLKLVAIGLNYSQIAKHYGNAERTIRNHMVSVRVRLNAINTPHAIAIAKDRGLI